MQIKYRIFTVPSDPGPLLFLHMLHIVYSSQYDGLKNPGTLAMDDGGKPEMLRRNVRRLGKIDVWSDQGQG